MGRREEQGLRWSDQLRGPGHYPGDRWVTEHLLRARDPTMNPGFYFYLFSLRYHPPPFKFTALRCAIPLLLTCAQGCMAVSIIYFLSMAIPPKRSPVPIIGHSPSPSPLPPPQPTAAGFARCGHATQLGPDTLRPCVPGVSPSASCCHGPPRLSSMSVHRSLSRLKDMMASYYVPTAALLGRKLLHRRQVTRQGQLPVTAFPALNSEVRGQCSPM